MRVLTRVLLLLTLPLAGSALGKESAIPSLARSSQLLVVVSDGWSTDHGTLQRFQREGRRWRPEGTPITVALGRSGSGWGIGLHPAMEGGPRKVEGDGRSPAGVFQIDGAFGYAASAATAMPYQPMLDSSYCMDVPDSPFYNRIVDADQVGADAVEGSTEPMRLDLHKDGDVRYRQGLLIAHNPNAVAGAGSCIFAHLRRHTDEATSGCTAMDAPAMQQIFAWLRPEASPLFVLLPRTQYERLQQAWQLPTLPTGAPE